MENMHEYMNDSINYHYVSLSFASSFYTWACITYLR